MVSRREGWKRVVLVYWAEEVWARVVKGRDRRRGRRGDRWGRGVCIVFDLWRDWDWNGWV